MKLIKKYGTEILQIASLVFIVFVWFTVVNHHNEKLVETTEKPETNVAINFEEPTVILPYAGVERVLNNRTIYTDTDSTEKQNKYMRHFDEEESYLLAKIAMAEAEGEDFIGKALVIMTVLNRVESDDFPDTISEVIYQEGQFTPIANGRFDSVEPDEECYKALRLVGFGWNESQGALYFERATEESTWHNRNLTKLFTYGNHTFYTEVASE